MTEPPRRRRRRVGGHSPEAVAAANFRRSYDRELARERLREAWDLASAPTSFLEAIIDDDPYNADSTGNSPGGGL